MNDYIIFMHNDAKPGNGNHDDAWDAYLTKLGQSGAFQGGSAIGGGICLSKAGIASEITSPLSGYIRVQATDLQQARQFVDGNPVYEAGGTIEIRELPKT